jgi:hypothetical protein
MSLTLEIPQDLERELSAEAAQLGLALSEYALQLLYGRPTIEKRPRTGAELVAYWEEAGLVGSRSDIEDGQAHARRLRARAESRRRD